MRTRSNRALWKILVPGAVLFQISGCLSDAQLTQLLTGVITTGLSTLLNQAIVSLFSVSAGGTP